MKWDYVSQELDPDDVDKVDDRIINEFGIGGVICVVCEGNIDIVQNTCNEVGVCDGCADVIANLYCHTRSGEFLSWKKNGAKQ